MNTKTKQEIRREAKEAVKRLNIEQKKSKSSLIFKIIADLEVVKQAKNYRPVCFAP